VVTVLTVALPVRELEKFVSAINVFSQTNMVGSEANTKKKIIEPMLEVLGWDTRGKEVRLEYPIKIGSTTKYVDYALMQEKKLVVLVEAKPFATTLSSDDSAQIISYGRVEDVRWVVLTNGKDLSFFDTREGKSEKKCLVFRIDLMKLPAQSNHLYLVSKQSIFSRDTEEAVKRLAASRKAALNLEQRRSEIAVELKKILLNITGTEVENQIESLSKQLSEQVIQLFKKQSETDTIETPRIDVHQVSRRQLAMKTPGKVVVCPSRISGVDFLKKYNAWGFVKMREEDIPYFALYVGRPESSILYFGEIESITKPLKSKEDIVKIQETDVETFEPGTRVIHLKPGTLVKFVDPVPLKNNRFVPKGRLYTTLEKLTQADKIEFLWGVKETTVEYHFAKIKNAKVKKMAFELRDAILKIADMVEERTVKSAVLFRTSINFAGIYTHQRNFWLSVRIPKGELSIPELDARPEPNPKWTDIRVDEKTSLDSLIKAARLAYQRTF